MDTHSARAASVRLDDPAPSRPATCEPDELEALVPRSSVPSQREEPAFHDALDLALPLRVEYAAAASHVTARATHRAWALAQRLAALAGCLLLAPVFALMYAAVRATSPGPFLFSQQRPGRGGRSFAMLKVRTMRVGSEAPTALGTARGDTRITVVGRWLRDLKLDELPQLWNVARGEMELVGPRPLPAALDEELRKHIPGFERRYEVHPGLTNVSQVAVLDNKLGERLVDDWKLRFEGELHYIEHKSFTYDVVVLAMTVLFVARKLAALCAARLRNDASVRPRGSGPECGVRQEQGNGEAPDRKNA